MSHPNDPVDLMRARLGELYPDLDTSGFGVVGRVLRLAGRLEQRRLDHLASFDLTPGDFDVLATIRRTEGDHGVKPRELLAAVLITSGGLTKRLDRLEAADLVGRHPDPDDRRGTLVRLTPEGARLVDEALPSLLTLEGELVAEVLTERQTEQAADLLRRLILAM